MTRNDDGSITLDTDDIRGLYALIAAAQRGLASKDVLTSEDATQFLQRWNVIQ